MGTVNEPGRYSFGPPFRTYGTLWVELAIDGMLLSQILREVKQGTFRVMIQLYLA